jgi:hypothetical protein
MGDSRWCALEMKGYMMFSVIHMDSSGDDDPPIESLPVLYEELFASGIMDGNVAVINQDTGWCISAHRDGRLVFEQLGDDGKSTRHMIPVPKEQVLRLWKRLIDGDIDGILSEPWKPGYISK